MKREFIDIKIDRLTDCLIKRSTGEEVNTTVKAIVPNKKEFKDWSFDWSKPIKNSENVYALYVIGVDEIQGLVSIKPESGGIYISIVESAPHNKGSIGKYEGVGAHLFAIACKEALNNGMDFVFFDAKSELIEYYKDVLGAKQIGRSQRMLIEGGNFKDLIIKYFKEV